MSTTHVLSLLLYRVTRAIRALPSCFLLRTKVLKSLCATEREVNNQCVSHRPILLGILLLSRQERLRTSVSESDVPASRKMQLHCSFTTHTKLYCSVW